MNSLGKLFGISIISWTLLFSAFKSQAGPMLPGLFQDITQGALRVEQPNGVIVECPLRHTEVQAEISGMVSRVRVTQTFFNPFEEPIEAVYLFPLPHRSAVDEMTMLTGQRRIIGKIDRREQARILYEQALAQGQTAALLEQERPNIFTQSVANIEPGQTVKIEIAYVDVLDYDMGVYEFHFPMVVGPRYNASAPFPGTTGGPRPDPAPIVRDDPTTKPHGVNPSILKPGFRTGHDISLAVRLDAGVPIRDITTPTHLTAITKDGMTGAEIVLSSADSIPNKDFVLRYAVAGEKPEMAILAHKPSNREDGYFMLMIQPRIDEQMKTAPPREFVFLIDISGSMSGPAIQKVRESMQHFNKRLKNTDTLQIITFASSTDNLFPAPVPATRDNLDKALAFTDSLQARGGTRMLEGIRSALAEPADPDRVRICVLLTDGYIGDEAEIIREIGEKAGDRIRFWTVGMGSSPNRFLIDGVAKQGGGMAKILGNDEDAEPLVAEIVDRIHRAQLSDITINWGSLEIFQTFPTRIPELWAGRPVIVYGRYGKGGRDTILIDGMAEGQPLSFTLPVQFPERQRQGQSLSKVWAREKIRDLMQSVYMQDDPDVVEEITRIALQYNLMSQYTSFVAVDDSKAPHMDETRKPPRRVDIPVPLPKGVEFEGIFGRSFSDDARNIGYLASEVAFDAGGFQTGAFAHSIERTTRTSAKRYRMERHAVSSPQMLGMDSRWTAHPKTPALMSEEWIASPKVLAQPPIQALGRPARPLFDASVYPGFVSGHNAPDNPQIAALVKEASTAFQANRMLQARGLAQQAWLLGMQADHRGSMPGDIHALLQEIETAWFEQKAESIPALNQKMDRVIRNQTLREALGDIGRDLQIEFDLVPGAEKEVSQLLGREKLLLHYYDIQKMLAADALDWILGELHLIWIPENSNKITVTTSRRLADGHPWVYDVAASAISTSKEQGQSYQEIQDNFQKSIREYVEAIRSALSLPEKSLSIGMIEPGQLMVFGDTATHKKAESIIHYLQTTDIHLNSLGLDLKKETRTALTNLQKVTASRYADRLNPIQHHRTTESEKEALARLDRFGWKLLADSAKGRLDLEALTELQIAMDQLQSGETQETHLVPRTVWILTEAASTLHHEELTDTAKKAISRQLRQLPFTLKNLKQQPEQQELFLGVIYDTLALQNGMSAGWLQDKDVEQIKEEAVSLIRRERTGIYFHDLRLSATALLAESDHSELSALFEDRIAPLQPDADQLVLRALAAFRYGQETWKPFRAYVSTQLGQSPVPGSLAIYIHGLDETQRLMTQADSKP